MIQIIYTREAPILHFFKISIGFKRRTNLLAKQYSFPFCKMSENEQFFKHMHSKIAKSAIWLKNEEKKCFFINLATITG